MIPIIKWEILQRKNNLFWWCISTLLLIALLMLIYPSFHKDAAQLNQALNQLPDSIKSLKTGGSDIDVTSAEGYLHAQVFYSTLPLVLGIFTISLGKALGSRDELHKTLELVLARPIGRSKLLLSKGIAGILMCALITLLVGASIAMLANLVDMNIAFGNILTTTAWTMALITSFGVISFSLSAASQRLRSIAVPFAIIMSFGGYLMTSLSGITSWMEKPAKLFPFHYFDPRSMLFGEQSKGLAIYLLCILTLGTIIAWYGFRQRDLD